MAECECITVHPWSLCLAVDGHVQHISSEDGSHVHCQEEHAVHSNQQETDTRVIINIKWAQDQGYRAVYVCSSDADVFFILMRFAKAFEDTFFLDTGTKQHKRVLSISDIAAELGEPLCYCLLSFYAFTGKVANWTFGGMGKINPPKKL